MSRSSSSKPSLNSSRVTTALAKSVRNFSSGCIRLQKPITLAEVMLAADGQDPGQVRRILDSKKTTRVNLKTPVPVHLTYLTAWIGEGGTVEFRDDIYGRDALLEKAGSDRSRILQAIIWLADMADFAEMNAVWDKWVVPGHTPARATGEAKLAAPEYRVEVIVTAAVKP